MERAALTQLLEAVAQGRVPVTEALTQLSALPFHDMGMMKIDHHRALRTGYPEVIFCQNKEPDHVVQIVQEQIAHDETVFGTRASSTVMAAVKDRVPEVTCNETARCFWKKSSYWKPQELVRGEIVIVSAGTADAPVTEEARCTLDITGHPCRTIHDAGVAGIHRLFAHQQHLQRAAVILVVAGMEGALPSVVTGLVSCPVIGVPTSVGYGAHLNGMVPLLAMVNSCASGLSVVNIDNGFGAAMAAARINRAQG